MMGEKITLKLYRTIERMIEEDTLDFVKGASGNGGAFLTPLENFYEVKSSEDKYTKQLWYEWASIAHRDYWLARNANHEADAQRILQKVVGAG